MTQKPIAKNYADENFRATNNQRGLMHRLTEIGEQFIHYAITCDKPVIDMGAAYGVTTIPAVTQGATVIACDMEQTHLDEIANTVPAQFKSKLTLKRGYFPKDFDFAENSIGAIHCSFLLNFLNPEELEQALNKCYRWLVKGGKLFICSYSMHIGVWNEAFYQDYQEKKQRGEKWPGWTEIKKYTTDNDMLTRLPNFIYMAETENDAENLKKIGFQMERANYIDCRDGKTPPQTYRNGKEWSSIIAVK